MSEKRTLCPDRGRSPYARRVSIPGCAVVGSFAELAQHSFVGGVNALCWSRILDGDFREVAHALAPSDGMVTVDVDALHALSLSAAGRVAATAIVDDLHALSRLGRDPVLNCIARYERDERGLPIQTDVLSFHADRAPVECDTWLCTYWGKSSEGLATHDARRLIDDAAICSALRRHYASLDDDEFHALVREESFDLHYRAADGARPYSFGVGHLWRIAVEWPASPVPPCVHRAPATSPGDEPRLLLIC